MISAQERIGLDALLRNIQERLFSHNEIVSLRIPYEQSSVYFSVRQKYLLLEDSADDKGYRVKIEVNIDDLAPLNAYRENA